MRRICLLCLLMAGHFALLATSRDTVTWSTRRLDFKDFRMQSASEDFENSLKLNSHTTLEGYIYNGIHFRYRQQGRRLICEVKAYMVPSESFIRNREDEATLEHEQAHFDITELHARKLYEALYNYDFNSATFKKDIAAIYEGIVKEKEAMQEAYDRETDHSRRRRAQFDWLERIDSMLNDTELYSSYP